MTSAEVDERTLREIHVPAFEAAVQEAGVWSVMTAYNRLNGTYLRRATRANRKDPVRRVGFDGLVMSDWFGTHSTVRTAEAGLDLEMPGPPARFGPALAYAVHRGRKRADPRREGAPPPPPHGARRHLCAGCRGRRA
jgi:beta-glucosidase